MATSIGEIRGTLSLRDQFTGAMERAASRLQKHAKNIERTGRRMSEVGSSLTQALTLPVVAIGGGAVKAFSDFDGAMRQSLAIMGDVSDAMEDRMAASAREMAKTTTFSAKQAAESYFFLASAGLKAEQSIGALPKVAAFAQAGMFDMARATDLLTDAQSALGLTVEDTAENVRNMARVSDVLVGANTLANASVEQFSIALTSKAGAALKSFNKDIEEGVAVLAAFADQGVKAELAGNALDRILRLLPSAANKSADAYKRFGVEVFDSSGRMNNLADIIGDLEQALAGMSDQQKQAALEALGFQARVQGVIKPLLGTSEAIREYQAELENMAGITEEVSAKQLEAFGEQLKLVKDRLVDAGIELGENLAPLLLGFTEKVLVPAIGAITKLVKVFGALPTPVQAVIVALAGLAAVAGPVLLIVGKLLTAWGALAASAPGVTAALVSIGSRMTALALGPVGALAIAVVSLASVAEAAITKWRNSSERDINAMTRNIDMLRDKFDGLREAMRRGVITDEEIVNARRGIAELTKQIREIDRQLKFESDRSKRDGLLFDKKSLEAEKQNLEKLLKVASRLPKINDVITVSAQAQADAIEGLNEANREGIEAQLSRIQLMNDAKSSLADLTAGLAVQVGIVETSTSVWSSLSTTQARVFDGMQDLGVGAADALRIALGKTNDRAEELTRQLAENIGRVKELLARAKQLREELDAAISQEIDISAGRSGGGEIPAPELEPVDVIIFDEEKLRRQHGEYIEKIRKDFEEEYAKKTQAVMERAWQNIQDIATDAIADIIKTGEVDFKKLGDAILDIFANMLAELLVQWAINAAKRIALEKAVAAAGGASGGGSSLSLSGGGGGLGGGNAAWSAFKNGAWVQYVGTAALVAAAAFIAYRAIKRNEGNRLQDVGGISVADGNVSGFGQFGSGRYQEVLSGLQSFFDELESLSRGVVQTMADLNLRISEKGDLFEVSVAGLGTVIFSSLQEALSWGLRNALSTAEWSGLSDAWDPFVDALQRNAFTSLEQVMEVAQVISEIEAVSLSPVEEAIDSLNRKWDEVEQKLGEVGISIGEFGQQWGDDWQSIRDSITGVSLTAEERFRRDMEIFNARLAAEKAEQEAKLAAAEASVASAEAEIARLEVLINSANISGQIASQMMANWQEALDAANATLAQATTDADAARQLLANLPDPIDPSEFTGGANTASRDMERLRESIDQMRFDRLTSGMTELDAGLARLGREYEQQMLLAHGNAELVAALTAEYAAQEEQLRRNIQLSAVDKFQNFLGIGSDSFSQLREQWQDARAAVEGAGFGADRAAMMLRRLDASLRQQLDTLSRQEFVSIGDGVFGILERYYSGVEGFEELRMRLEQVRFELELHNLRARFEILKAEGTLSEAILAQLQEAFDFIDANPIDWEAFTAPSSRAVSAVSSAARSVSSAVEEMARRLESAHDNIRSLLRDLQTGALGGRSNEQGFDAALAQFREVTADPTNIQSQELFPEVARRLAELARERFGSTARFQEILAEIEGAGIDFLGVDRVTEDNVVFDQRFFDQQSQHISVNRQGHETVADAVRSGFAQRSADEERSREDILEELRKLRESQDKLARRIEAIQTRGRTDKRSAA